MDGLKPCPFCGGSVSMVINKRWRTYQVYHEDIAPCLVGEPFKIPMNHVVQNRDDAIKAWNRRIDNGHP